MFALWEISKNGLCANQRQRLCYQQILLRMNGWHCMTPLQIIATHWKKKNSKLRKSAIYTFQANPRSTHIIIIIIIAHRPVICIAFGPKIPFAPYSRQSMSRIILSIFKPHRRSLTSQAYYTQRTAHTSQTQYTTNSGHTIFLCAYHIFHWIHADRHQQILGMHQCSGRYWNVGNPAWRISPGACTAQFTRIIEKKNTQPRA